MKRNPADVDDVRPLLLIEFVQSLGRTAAPVVGSNPADWRGRLKRIPADADDVRPLRLGKFVQSLGRIAAPAVGSKASGSERERERRQRERVVLLFRSQKSSNFTPL